MQNTLQNNASSFSGITPVFENAISAPSTYYNPACFYGFSDGSPTGPPFPTAGADFGCDNAGQVNEKRHSGSGDRVRERAAE